MRTKLLTIFGLLFLAISSYGQQTGGGGGAGGGNPFGGTVTIIRPGQDVSNAVASLVNNSKLVMAPGNYGVPRMGTVSGIRKSTLNIYHKTNITIEAYGARITNSTPGRYGCLFAISNCTDIKILGLTMDGGGIVNTNDGADSTEIAMIADMNNVEIAYCTFLNAHHGMYGGDQMTNVWIHHNYFYSGGDTNWPGAGGAGVDGAAIAVAGTHTRIEDNTIVRWARGIEVYGNGAVPKNMTVARNIVKHTKADNAIWLFSPVTNVAVIDNQVWQDVGDHNQAVFGMFCFNINAGVGITVSGNVIRGSLSQQGVYIAATASEVLVQNNSIQRCHTGMTVFSRGTVIANNWMSDNHRYAVAVRGHQIVLDGNNIRNTLENIFGAIHLDLFDSITAITNTTIANNILWDDQASPTTKYGIEIGAAGVTNTVIRNNHFNRMVTANITGTGINTTRAARGVLEGVATLSSGLATVNTTMVGANSRIILTPRATADPISAVGVTNVVNGTSFQIRSASNTDDNAVHWVMSEPQ